MRAGENVCIHKMSPAQRRSALASRTTLAITSPEVITGLSTILRGMWGLALRPDTICLVLSATIASTSSP